MSNNKIAPSILAADYANFASELKRIEETSAEYVHIDIMDGQFVPNISFGADVVASMRKHSKLVFDCHLMVVNPERYVDAFAQAGADIMTIHAESTLHIHGALQKIKAAGMKAGVVINPGTPVSAIESVLSLVDQVLIMTVNPGLVDKPSFLKRLKKWQKLLNSAMKKAMILTSKLTVALIIRLSKLVMMLERMSLLLVHISSKQVI